MIRGFFASALTMVLVLSGGLTAQASIPRVNDAPCVAPNVYVSGDHLSVQVSARPETDSDHRHDSTPLSQLKYGLLAFIDGWGPLFEVDQAPAGVKYKLTGLPLWAHLTFTEVEVNSVGASHWGPQSRVIKLSPIYPPGQFSISITPYRSYAGIAWVPPAMSPGVRVVSYTESVNEPPFNREYDYRTFGAGTHWFRTPSLPARTFFILWVQVKLSNGKKCTIETTFLTKP
ncbi:hypothetical protein QDR37_14370 [Amnibacterium sp. CER49]|uniref:hypothetical protein n=1 Tax=Amnibacterium sp. CER49 TaxID=3039161 RepID=UPI00244AB17A|nr:hypothetical protein [Amnibacterium sp. CER49]MDH2445135.1 hypothetical protein [Amnibacterium sp. CER49]